MRSKYLSDNFYKLQRRNTCCYTNGEQRRVSTQTVPKDVKPFESMPGLSSLPLIGPLHHFLPVIGEIGPEGDLFGKFGDFRAKYGPIMKMEGIFARSHFVFLFEPEHFEQVFKAEETNPLRPGFETLTYYREELRKSTFQGVYGLTTAQGAQWREFRTKVNPAMLKPKLIKLYAPGLEEIADDMVARISSQLKNQNDGLQERFESEITKWSLESVALVGLGSRLGCLRDDVSEDHPGMKLIQCAKDFIELATKLEIKPNPWKYIRTPSYKKMIKVYDTQWDLSSIYINEAKKQINERALDVPEEDKSIIEKLLAIDEKVAIMMANEMLLAGIDTVAFTTMCLLYQLATNQNTQDKLRQEIRSDNSNRYLRACLKESLRIWHVVPATLRRTSKDHHVGGYHIPKGVDVIAPNQYLSNHEKHYPRPNEFLPERWLVEKHDFLYHGNAHPMVNLPFGFGVRSCIGRRIAELEIEIFIKKIINELKLTWEGPPIKVKGKLLNTIQMPFRIRFEHVK